MEIIDLIIEKENQIFTETLRDPKYLILSPESYARLIDNIETRQNLDADVIENRDKLALLKITHFIGLRICITEVGDQDFFEVI